MAASHFFTGIAAGLAVAGVAVVTLGNGSNLPGQIAAWVTGPSALASLVEDRSASRPQSGFVPGGPTPTIGPLPVVSPRPAEPTPTPLPSPTPPPPPSGVLMGKVRAGPEGIRVRRAVAVESPGDALLQNGTPIVLSSGGSISSGGQSWRAVRATGNVAGWLPMSAILLDGQPDPGPVVAIASPSAIASGVQRGMIVNTDGIGVTARSEPVDSAKLGYGFADASQVTIMERSGSDWVKVRADSGREGWIPSQYLRTTF